MPLILFLKKNIGLIFGLIKAVNPVSMGKTRSKQQSLCDGVFSNDINSTASATLNIQVR